MNRLRSRVRLGLASVVLAGTFALVALDQSDGASTRTPVFHAVTAPSGFGSAEPRLVAIEGGVALSWLERNKAGHELRWSRWSSRRRWTKPVTIAHGDSFFANWADFPSSRWLGAGTWAAHWLWKSGEDTYAYDVRMSFSRDNGQTWSSPVMPHRDGTKTEHGFVSLVEEGRAARAVWLDGRNFEGREEEHGGADMTVRSALLGPNGELREEVELDKRCCECCATAAVKTRSGVLIAYRDRSPEEVRDIALVRLDGGRWTRPYLLHADGWKIHGCPVNGPALDASGDKVVAAWFTAASDTARVLAAFSHDGGRSFSQPIRLDGGKPVGRVDTVLLPDGTALVSWLETAGDETSIKLRRVISTGRLGPVQTLAASSAARASGFPQMVQSGSHLWFAWTEPGDRSHIKMARALVSDFMVR